MKILVCGKGGCGKSTVSAILATAMQKRGKPVFLVDADESNIGLYRMLGLEVPEPLMDIFGGKKGFREKTKTAGAGLGGLSRLFPENMTIDDLPQECVASSGSIRVMSVGKIHDFGEGCACPMGSLFRMLFSSLSLEKEDLVIVDTAAGVEHFGRSLDGQCDHILCVVDPSYESIIMTKKVDAFARQAGLPVSIILNKVSPQVEKELDAALEHVDVAGRLPDDPAIFLKTLKGLPLDLDMPEIQPVCDVLEASWR